MVNVLLNLSNFDEPWAYGTLENYLCEGMKVLVLPLSYDEGWITDAHEFRERYGKGTDDYDDIVRPFLSFGIKEEDVSWISYYEDDQESAIRKINGADVLFFTGGYPDWMLQRLYDLGIKEAISRFDGIVMGASAGALIQLDLYHLTEEDGYEYQIQEGLGLLEGFDLDVHFEQDLKHVTGLIRSLEDMGRSIVCMPNRGGMLVDGDHFELLGDAFITDMNDLDELYEIYEQLLYGYNF